MFLGFYNDLKLHEKFPVLFKTNFLVQWLEDVSAPFFSAVKSEFEMKYVFADDLQYTTRIELHSYSTSRLAGISLNKFEYEIHFTKNGFESLMIFEGNNKTMAVCEQQ